MRNTCPYVHCSPADLRGEVTSNYVCQMRSCVSLMSRIAPGGTFNIIAMDFLHVYVTQPGCCTCMCMTVWCHNVQWPIWTVAAVDSDYTGQQSLQIRDHWYVSCDLQDWKYRNPALQVVTTMGYTTNGDIRFSLYSGTVSTSVYPNKRYIHANIRLYNYIGIRCTLIERADKIVSTRAD